MSKGNGFTLVELIIVIVLISIMSAVGIGLFSDPSQYQPRSVNESWVNQLRYSQRLAFLKSHSSEPLVLTINQDASAWRFNLTQDSASIDEYEIEHYGLTLRGSTSNFSASCSSLSAINFPVVIRFNGIGNLVNASGNEVTDNWRFCLAASTNQNWCIAPSGYAYGGDCVP